MAFARRSRGLRKRRIAANAQVVSSPSVSPVGSGANATSYVMAVRPADAEPEDDVLALERQLSEPRFD
ncbi:hypothetical protein ACWGQ5_25650 [Streptomyces sp. NPDC055722]